MLDRAVRTPTASVKVQIGNGQRTLFWLDSWIKGVSVSSIAPNLLQIISKRITKKRTVAEALNQRRWVRDIRGGLSVLILRDYIKLWQAISGFQLSDGTDKFIWRWTTDGQYTSASAYKIMHQGTTTLAGSSWIWKSWAPPRVKFFAWLAFRKRLWTADR